MEHLGSMEEIRRYYEAREMVIHDEITRITRAKEGIENKKQPVQPLFTIEIDRHR